MKRNALAWTLRAALLAVGIATVAHPGDAGTRVVPIAAIIHAEDGRPVVLRNRTHTSTGIVHPRCLGPNLYVEPRPVSQFAAAIVAGLDGWLLDHGYAAGVPSSQGGRVLIGFTRDGAPIDCAEVFSHPEANVHLVGSVLR